MVDPGLLELQSVTVSACLICRKQLLNKCQEEFEKGAAAMEAVEAREKAEQGKTKEQKEQDQAEASAPRLTAVPSTTSSLAHCTPTTSCLVHCIQPHPLPCPPAHLLHVVWLVVA